ncbi:DNA alkylation repair protein [Microlunatus ginsengisoli]|uniref:DNA alkylation repair protein n=1 Tax=Microlunatus ginsengisoli TaxID=363863 RepID=A0ABP6ZI99_9ACTN
MTGVAAEVRAAIDAAADPEVAAALGRYFQVRPGGYGEGDVFAGVQLSRLRELVAPWRRVPFAAEDWLPLLTSPVHEHRLAALVVMAERAGRSGDAELDRICRCYLDHTAYVDNWDLVDVSAAKVLGRWLLDRDRTPLYDLTGSGSLWERRIAVVATHQLIRHGQTEDTYRLAVRLIGDREDLIHKAVGWMLREAGKHVDPAELLGFLDAYAADLPRTTLRYAIEHLPREVRRAYLAR